MTEARRTYSLIAFALLACAFGWMFILIGLFSGEGGSGQFPLGPGIAAALVAAVLGRSELRSWWRTLATLRTGPGWYLVALLVPVVLLGAFVLVNTLFGAPLPTGAQLSRWPTLGPEFLGILIAIGIGEEAGWTAFAAPRLLARHSFVVAWLLLATMRTVWHVPLMLQGDLSVSIGIGGNFAFQFVVLWLFQRTRVWFLAALWHTVQNTVGGGFLFPMADSADRERLGVILVVGYWCVVLAVLVLDRSTRRRTPVPAPPPTS